MCHFCFYLKSKKGKKYFFNLKYFKIQKGGPSINKNIKENNLKIEP